MIGVNYSNRFGSTLRRCLSPPQELSKEDASFLKTIGLPDSAPGCLGFTINREIQSVRDKGWSKREDSALWFVIGHEGAGDPVVIDAPSGKIFVLDHENEMQRRALLNSSLLQLASTLLAVSNVMQTDHELDDDAVYSELFQELVTIDFDATLDFGFWPNELAMMLGDTIEPQWSNL